MFEKCFTQDFTFWWAGLRCIILEDCYNNDVSLKDAGKTFVYYEDGSSKQGTYIGINNPCVVYTCKADGSDIEYELGSNADITEGSYIAAFAIDKDSAGVADIVLVVEDEAANLLKKVDGTNAAYQFKWSHISKYVDQGCRTPAALLFFPHSYWYINYWSLSWYAHPPTALPSYIKHPQIRWNTLKRSTLNDTIIYMHTNIL